jgi:hypothetical protein
VVHPYKKYLALKLGVHFFEEKSPFLIRHNDNGLIYRFGDIDDFYEKLKHVVENEGLRRSISLRGSESISGLRNRECRAKRLIALPKVMEGKK